MLYSFYAAIGLLPENEKEENTIRDFIKKHNPLYSTHRPSPENEKRGFRYTYNIPHKYRPQLEKEGIIDW